MLNKLIRMKELIEQGWTQGAMARDTEGYSVAVHQSEACCWCLHGAYQRCDYLQPSDLYHLLLSKTDGLVLSLWNDRPERTKSDVIELIDTLIEEQNA